MTSRVAELFAELSERGITLRPAGAFLGVSPRSALTPDLVARIRELKSEILSTLNIPPPADRSLLLAGASPAEWATLVAIAARPGLRLPAIGATTRLSSAVLAEALFALSRRREIMITAAGGHHLVAH